MRIEALNGTHGSKNPFQQHYLGRWVIDDPKLVYRYVRGLLQEVLH